MIGKRVLYEVCRTVQAEVRHEGDNVKAYHYFYSDRDSAIAKYDELCCKYPYPKSRHITLKRWNTSGMLVTDIYTNRFLHNDGKTYRDVSKLK